MQVVTILLLILLNGFFSMSEIAIVSFRKIRIENYADKHKKGVMRAIQLQDSQEEFLASIQICITLISLINGFIGGSDLARYMEPLFLKIQMAPGVASTISVVLSIILVTFFTIVLGELVPKTIGLSNPEKASVRVAPTIYFVSKLFSPIVKLLSGTTALVDRMIGVKKTDDHLTEDELRDMIKEAGETDVIEEEQSEMHEKIFYFSDKRAKHIMLHRSEIEWIDINLPENEFIEQLSNSKNSRVLVCDKHIEQYLGVLNVKEFFISRYKQDQPNVQDLLDAPLVFTETMEAQDILNEFRKAQFYFGVVIDEFGELEGIVTLHDILENIVGEMPEEEEVVEPDVFVREDQSVLVNGDAPVEVLVDVMDGFEIDFEDVDYSTVAGFVLEQIEKTPEVGDSFDFLNYCVEIVDTDHNRIDKVLVTKMKNEESSKEI